MSESVRPRDRVLVIDDDRIVHRLFRACLRGWGDPTCVSDVEAGLRDLQGTLPRLVVVGLPMSDGAGFRVLRFLYEADLMHIPVLALLSLPLDWETLVQTFVPEASPRLPRPQLQLEKPLEPDLLQSLVRTLLGWTGKTALTALIVHADASAVEALAEAWSRHDMALVHAPTGAEAVRRYVQEGPDMVLLWPCLPDMPGPEVLARIRAADPEAVVFGIMEGETFPEDPRLTGRLPGFPFILEAGPLVREGFWQALRARQWAAGQERSRAFLRDWIRQARRSAEDASRLSGQVEALSRQVQQYLGVAERLIARVRGLLTFAQGHADLLLERPTALEPGWRQYLEGLLQVVWDIQQVLDNLDVGLALQRRALDFQVRPVTLAEVVHAVLDRFGPDLRQRNLRVELDVPEDLPAWYGDEGKFRVILQNLLSNAIRFTPEGGTVGVSLHHYPAGRVKSERIPLPLRQHHDVFVLAVRDTGVGLRPDVQDRVFEPFQQVSDMEYGGRQGLGLGLAVVRGLVEHMGGTVWVESRYGVGSAFYVAFPGRLGATRPA